MVGNGPMEMKLLEKQENSKNMLKIVSSNQFSFVWKGKPALAKTL